MEKLTEQRRKFTDKEIEMFLELLPEVMDQRRQKLVTIEEYFDEYLKEVKEIRSEKYYRSHLTSYGHLMKRIKGNVLLREITQKTANDIILDIKREVPKGVDTYLKNLKAAFTRAVEWKFLDENPFDKVRLGKRQQVEASTINRDELYDIWLKIDNQVVRDIATVGFFTGMRLSEIVNLKWSDVDFEIGEITVGSDSFQTKTKSYRKVPFRFDVECAMSSNLDSKGKSEYIFTKDNIYPYTPSHVSRLFKRGVRSWGRNARLKFHNLRHSYATYTLELMGDIFLVKTLLGHSQISTTQGYVHPSLDKAHRLADMM